MAIILGYIGIVFNYCYSYACVHLPCKNSKKYSIYEDFVFALINSLAKDIVWKDKINNISSDTIDDYNVVDHRKH